MVNRSGEGIETIQAIVRRGRQDTLLFSSWFNSGSQRQIVTIDGPQSASDCGKISDLVPRSDLDPNPSLPFLTVRVVTRTFFIFLIILSLVLVLKLINHNLPLPEKLSGLNPPCQTNLNCEKLSGGWTRSTVRAAGADSSTRGSQRNLLTSYVSLWASLIDCFRSRIPKRHSERQERS